MTECAKAFTEIYERGFWGAGSGGGSNPHAMKDYITLVEDALRTMKPRTVLDIGCGDGRIAAAINWGDAHYIGIDCVSFCVAMARTGGPDLRELDATVDELPDADLVLVKEVTQHLPNAMIFALLEKLKRYPAVIHTSACIETINSEIAVGETRGVFLDNKPFNLDTLLLCVWPITGVNYQTELWRPSC